MDGVFYNSLTEGDFGSGRVLCQSLIEGDFWSRLQGCCNVFRGEDSADNIDYSHIIASHTGQGSITMPAYLEHLPGRDYFYALRCVSGSGRRELGSMAVVKLSLDSTGKLKLPHPNNVQNLTAWQVGRSAVRIYWWYVPVSQQAVPDYFAVYGDGGSGVIDFSNMLMRVEYRGGFYFSTIIAPLQPGRYKLAVQVVSTSGVCDGNSNYTEVTVIGNPPGITVDITTGASLN